MTPMDYRKKLGLCVNDQTKAMRFYAQMHNFFKGAYEIAFDGVLERAFCDRIGVPTNETNQLIADIWSEPTGLERAWIYLKEYKADLLELLFCCVTLINTYPKSQEKIKEALQLVLLNALDDCQIAYDLFTDDDEIFIFPKGAKELDDALVSQPLEWLKDYPKSHKTYCTALRQYSDGIFIRDVADNLRKTLEGFLQEFLCNDKNLETNKNEICKYLGTQGIDAGISGLFQPLINAYKNINDRIAKHNDKVDKKMLEFLLYQTGVLIRMVLAVKQAETEEPTDAD